MTRTADHVLFGRTDLAGDATDSAHRPPMVERGGPRSDRGGGPLPPTSVAGFPHTFPPPPLPPFRPPAPPPPLSLSPPPPARPSCGGAAERPVPHSPPTKSLP